ncbi:hypothetical protein [Archangium sp.]|uniref:hypothetical protein n=1 Tax=Archangium sp. TaxID=1872627 RepID=UPI002D582613|nr:hypothetical protein [Archangium sp.]HYO52013.1 hypothetical protein [Archangium sp.]
MKMRGISLVLAVSLLGCGYLRSLFPHQAPVEDDRSIVFPRFLELVPVEVGAPGEPYELDGEMLQALVIASNDYIPPDARDLPCPSRREAQSYRVIRQGDIIFVYIYENHAYCGRQYPVRHQGGKYAISTDGRILRRLIGDQPEGPVEPETLNDGGRWIRAEPGVSSEFDAIWNPLWDGGTAPTGPNPASDGGFPSISDSPPDREAE